MVAVVALLAAAALGALVGHAVWSSPTTPTTSPAVPGAPSNAASLAAGIDPALVDIDITDSYESLEEEGTGMVLSSGGEVLTNNHVIEGETTISVRDVGNGRTYGATVVGYDRSQDIAVIQLTDASGLKTVKLGNSSTVATGDGVVAVGNAEGAGGTPKYAGGTVIATDQSITAQDEVNGTSEHLSGLIETDADIVPGDSGGALLNRAGQVIGMTTAGSEGFEFTATEGYAIPINEADTVAKQVAARQSSSTIHIGPTAFLGVLVRSTVSGISGAQIDEVIPGGPAAQAGLSAGDTITALNGQTVTSPESLTDPLLSLTPGTTVRVQYLDPSGLSHSVTVRLGSGPPQ